MCIEDILKTKDEFICIIYNEKYYIKNLRGTKRISICNFDTKKHLAFWNHDYFIKNIKDRSDCRFLSLCKRTNVGVW